MNDYDFCQDCGTHLALHYGADDCERADRRAAILCAFGLGVVAA